MGHYIAKPRQNDDKHRLQYHHINPSLKNFNCAIEPKWISIRYEY